VMTFIREARKQAERIRGHEGLEREAFP